MSFINPAKCIFKVFIKEGFMPLFKIETAHRIVATSLLGIALLIPGTAFSSQRQLIVAITDIKAAPGCDSADAARMTAQVRADMAASGGLAVMDRLAMDSILGNNGADLADTCSSTKCRGCHDRRIHGAHGFHLVAGHPGDPVEPWECAGAQINRCRRDVRRVSSQSLAACRRGCK
jgi:hypothetical protein